MSSAGSRVWSLCRRPCLVSSLLHSKKYGGNRLWMLYHVRRCSKVSNGALADIANGTSITPISGPPAEEELQPDSSVSLAEATSSQQQRQFSDYTEKLSKLKKKLKLDSLIELKEIYACLQSISGADVLRGEDGSCLLACCLIALSLDHANAKLQLVDDILRKFKSVSTIDHINEKLLIYLAYRREFSPVDVLKGLSKNGLEPNERTLQLLIARYCFVGDMESANLLDLMKSQAIPVTPVLYHLLIFGFAKKGMFEQVENVLNVARHSDSAVNSVEFEYKAHVAVASGTACNGHIDSTQKALNDASIVAPLQFKDWLRVFLNLTEVGHAESRSLLSCTKQIPPVYREDVRSVIDAMLRLLSCGYPDAAFAVLESLKPIWQNGQISPDTLSLACYWFLHQLIFLHKAPPELVRNYAKRIEELFSVGMIVRVKKVAAGQSESDVRNCLLTLLKEEGKYPGLDDLAKIYQRFIGHLSEPDKAQSDVVEAEAIVVGLLRRRIASTPRAPWMLCSMFTLLKQSDKALHYYTLTLRLRSTFRQNFLLNALPLFDLIGLLLNEGNIKGALELAETVGLCQVWENTPSNRDCLEHMFTSAIAAGGSELLSRLFQTIIARCTTLTQASLCSALVSAHLNRKELTAAVDAYEFALQKVGKASVSSDINTALLLAGAPTSLIERVFTACANVNGPHNAALNLAISYIEVGRSDAAAKLFVDYNAAPFAVGPCETWCRKLSYQTNAEELLTNLVVTSRNTFFPRDLACYYLAGVYAKSCNAEGARNLWNAMNTENIPINDRTKNLLDRCLQDASRRSFSPPTKQNFATSSEQHFGGTIANQLPEQRAIIHKPIAERETPPAVAAVRKVLQSADRRKPEKSFAYTATQNGQLSLEDNVAELVTLRKGDEAVRLIEKASTFNSDVIDRLSKLLVESKSVSSLQRLKSVLPPAVSENTSLDCNLALLELENSHELALKKLEDSREMHADALPVMKFLSGIPSCVARGTGRRPLMSPRLFKIHRLVAKAVAEDKFSFAIEVWSEHMKNANYAKAEELFGLYPGIGQWLSKNVNAFVSNVRKSATSSISCLERCTSLLFIKQESTGLSQRDQLRAIYAALIEEKVAADDLRGALQSLSDALSRGGLRLDNFKPALIEKLRAGAINANLPLPSQLSRQPSPVSNSSDAHCYPQAVNGTAAPVNMPRYFSNRRPFVMNKGRSHGTNNQRTFFTPPGNLRQDSFAMKPSVSKSPSTATLRPNRQRDDSAVLKSGELPQTHDAAEANSLQVASCTPADVVSKTADVDSSLRRCTLQSADSLTDKTAACADEAQILSSVGFIVKPLTRLEDFDDDVQAKQLLATFMRFYHDTNSRATHAYSQSF